MKIDKHLLPIKLHYFFQIGGSAPIVPFLAVIGKDLGFSTTIVGLILTTVPLTSLVIKPVVGALADKFSIHKAIFIGLIALTLVSTFCIQFLPSLPVDRSVGIGCTDEGVRIGVETNRIGDECFMDKLAAVDNSSGIACRVECSNFDFLRSASAQSPNFTEAEVFVNLQLLRNVTSLPSSVHQEIWLQLVGPYSTAVKVTTASQSTSELTFDVESSTSGHHTWRPTCSPAVQTRCDLLCTEPLLQEAITKLTVSDAQVFSQLAFWLFALFIIVPRVFTSTVNSLGDSICFKLLDDRPNDYGYQRMWGAAGWGLFALVTGLIVDNMSRGKYITDYTAAYYLGAILHLIDIVVASKLKCSVSAKPPNIFANVKSVLTGNPRFWFFLAITVFCGIFSGLIWSFLLWFIEEVASEDGCSDNSWIKTLDGLTLAVHCYLGEIPFFWISGWMLKHIGHAYCMTIVLVAFAVRFVSYSLLTNAWWILPIEALNGITFATFYSTMTTYANALTPPDMQGTIQGFVAAIFEIGIGIGSISGGYVYSKFGGRMMYLIGGIIAAVLAGIHTLVHLVCGAEQTEKKEPAEEN